MINMMRDIERELEWGITSIKDDCLPMTREGEIEYKSGNLENAYEIYTSTQSYIKKKSNELKKETLNQIQEKYKSRRRKFSKSRGKPKKIKKTGKKRKNLTISEKVENLIEEKLEKLNSSITQNIESVNYSIKSEKEKKISNLLNCANVFENNRKFIASFRIIQRLHIFMTNYKYRDLIKHNRIYKFWKILHKNRMRLEFYFNLMAVRYYSKERYEKALRMYEIAKEIMKRSYKKNFIILTRLTKYYMREIFRCNEGIETKKARKLYKEGCNFESSNDNSKAIEIFVKAIKILESIQPKYRDKNLLGELRSKLII